MQYTGNHQKQQSPLIGTGILCINGFVLDYMHLVCLGVMRRLLSYMKKGQKGKLSNGQIKEVSLALVSLNGLLPRQPRTLNELDRWKTTCK